MKNIVISGANGRMGRVVADICRQDPELAVCAGFDVSGSGEFAFPVYSHPMEYTGPCDCVIDFSSPDALSGLLTFCREKRCGAVLATTGYSDEQLAAIAEASREIPIFRSANMSLGINVLLELVRQAAKKLEGFDIEIVEKHHNKKLDAPSGRRSCWPTPRASLCPTMQITSASARASAGYAIRMRSASAPSAAARSSASTRSSSPGATWSLN